MSAYQNITTSEHSAPDVTPKPKVDDRLNSSGSGHPRGENIHNVELRKCFKTSGVLLNLTPNTILQPLNNDTPTAYYMLCGQAYIYRESDNDRQQIFQLVFENTLLPPTWSEGNIDQVKLTAQSWVYKMDYSILDEAIEKSAALRREFIASTTQMIRAQRHIILLAAKDRAVEAVAGVILLALEHSGQNNSFEIHMSRKEIGQLLGLKFETVSRQISYLRKIGVIDVVKGRWFKVLDKRKLQDVFLGH